MSDRIKGDIADDGETVAVGKGIRQHSQKQSISMSTDRDVASLLFSVEREIQVVHREISTVKSQLQNGIYLMLLLLIVVVGVAIFIGDRQITRIDQRVHDIELQLRRIEQQIQRNQSPYTPPFGETP